MTTILHLGLLADEQVVPPYARPFSGNIIRLTVIITERHRAPGEPERWTLLMKRIPFLLPSASTQNQYVA